MSSELPHNAFYGLYWKVIGWWMLLSALFGLYIAGALGLVTAAGPALAGPDEIVRSIPLMVVMVIGYLAAVLAMNVVMRMYLQHDIWAKVLETLQVHDIGTAADVQGRGELASALGEGFADGLDVAGF